MPDALTLSLLLAGAAAGGFVNGLAGFGTALFALGFWLLVLPPVEAVALAASLSVLSGLQGVWVVRHGIAYRRLARFVVPAVLGLPLGVALLQHIDAAPLRRLIAVLLLGYGVWFSIRAIPRWRNVPRWADSGVGFLGGLLGGMAGLSGALPMLWCTLRGWSKAETRGVLQPFNVMVLVLAVVYYGVLGHLDTAFAVKLAISLPATLIAAQLGIGLFNRLADTQYRRLLVMLMVLSGLGLLWRDAVG
ncbi:MAG: sulfite exporter TauE/SafE family protein [Pseudomonadota bacterium]